MDKGLQKEQDLSSIEVWDTWPLEYLLWQPIMQYIAGE